MSTVPRITGKYKIVSDNTPVSINRLSDDYNLLFEYNTSGVALLYSMVAEFSSEDVGIKIELDGETSFEYSLKELDMITNQFQNSHYIVHLDKNNDAFILKPTFPVMVKSSIKLFARANTNSNSRSLEQYHIELSEE